MTDNNSWLKLYRKSKDNGILKDHKAWAMFSWILMSVDRKTGKYTTGRFMLSEALGLDGSTIYKVLKRLEKKWQVVTLESNNKFTTISVSHWADYQNTDEVVTQDGNNKVTTKEQQSNTKQEYKNKEYKNKEYKKREESITYLKELAQEDLQELSLKYKADIPHVRTKAETLVNYCEAHGKRYKNYKAFLCNALLKDFGLRPLIAQPQANSIKSNEKPITAQQMEELQRRKAQLLGGKSI